MSVHFQRQLGNLQEMILDLGMRIEEAVQHAIAAVHDRDPQLAQRVIDGDEHIDLTEVRIEEECLHTLALYQPVAMDLRYVVAVLKINNDLERIGDLAVNIAEQALALADLPQVSLPFDLDAMSRLVRTMLKQAQDALVNSDVELAERVRLADDEVDAIHRNTYSHVEEAIRRDTQHTEQYIHLLGVSRRLERIADHAVNIAKDVIYMSQGHIVRHKRRQ